MDAFFEFEHLYNTDAHIGAFRLRGKGQLSADHYGAYLYQCDTIVDKAILQLTNQARGTLKETDCNTKQEQGTHYFVPCFPHKQGRPTIQT